LGLLYGDLIVLVLTGKGEWSLLMVELATTLEEWLSW